MEIKNKKIRLVELHLDERVTDWSIKDICNLYDKIKDIYV